MPDYFYDMDLVVDPLNPSNVVANGSVAIYDPADTAGTVLLALKDPSGLPLPNPLTSNANGFLPPRIAQVPQTMWKSGGFTGYFNSYKGLRDEAVQAVSSAQTAANNAAAAAADRVTTAAVNPSGKLILTKADGTPIDAGAVIGPKGDKGDKGNDGANGANVLPTDDAIEQAVKTTGSKTATAMKAAFAPLNAGGARIIGSGDSHTERNTIANPSNAGSVILGGGSFFNQLCVRSGKLQYLYNDGISSTTTTQMLARFQANVLDKNPSIVHILGGTNDTTGGIPETTTIANLRAMIEAARKFGARVVIGTIPPRDTDDLALDNIDRVNFAIKSLASSFGADLIDYHSVLVDPANGHFKVGLTTDGVHPNDAGAKVMANLAVSVLNPTLPPFTLPVPTTHHAASPNRLLGMFLTDANADGVADGWTLSGTATSSTASLVTDPAVAGKAQRLVFSGATQRVLQAAVTSTFFTPGQRVAFTGRFKATLEAGSGQLDFNLRFNAATGSNTKLTPVYQWKSDTDGWVWFYIEGVIPPSTNLLYIQANAFSGAGTLEIAQWGVYILDEIATTA